MLFCEGYRLETPPGRTAGDIGDSRNDEKIIPRVPPPSFSLPLLSFPAAPFMNAGPGDPETHVKASDHEEGRDPIRNLPAGDPVRGPTERLRSS